jgi:copper chaperone CopZ
MSERTLSIEIDGMSCDGCVASVTRVLSRLPGVRVLKVAVGSAQVAVDLATTASHEKDLTGAIEKAGFATRGIQG